MIKFFKVIVFSLLHILCLNNLQAQKYLTKAGHAYFMSHTDAIDIDGNNHQVAAIADLESGDLVVIVLIKAFDFTLATAEKHFNETYMESDEFPKAIFKGNVEELKGIDLSIDVELKATAKGVLTIHGESQEIIRQGKLEIKEGKIKIDCNFDVSIDDYNIKVPKGVEDRVAKMVNISIELLLNAK